MGKLGRPYRGIARNGVVKVYTGDLKSGLGFRDVEPQTHQRGGSAAGYTPSKRLAVPLPYPTRNGLTSITLATVIM